MRAPTFLSIPIFIKNSKRAVAKIFAGLFMGLSVSNGAIYDGLDFSVSADIASSSGVHAPSTSSSTSWQWGGFSAGSAAVRATNTELIFDAGANTPGSYSYSLFSGTNSSIDLSAIDATFKIQATNAASNQRIRWMVRDAGGNWFLSDEIWEDLATDSDVRHMTAFPVSRMGWVAITNGTQLDNMGSTAVGLSLGAADEPNLGGVSGFGVYVSKSNGDSSLAINGLRVSEHEALIHYHPGLASHWFEGFGGDLRIGMSDMSGASFNEAYWNSADNIISSMNGRQSQYAFRSQYHSGLWNPTQAGFDEYYGTPIPIQTSTSSVGSGVRYEYGPWPLSLWQGDGQMDVSENEELTLGMPYAERTGWKDHPFSDVDNFDDSQVTQAEEVTSDFMQGGFVEDVSAAITQDVLALRLNLYQDFVRIGHNTLQFNTDAVKYDRNRTASSAAPIINDSLHNADISPLLPGQQASSPVNMTTVPYRWAARMDVLKAKFQYMWVPDPDTGEWTIHDLLPTSDSFSAAQGQSFTILADSPDVNAANSSKAVMIYYPEWSQVNRFSIQGIRSDTGEAVYQEDRRTTVGHSISQRTSGGWTSDSPRISLRFSKQELGINISGILSTNATPEGIYERFRQEFFWVFGTPKELRDAVTELDAYFSTRMNQPPSFSSSPISKPEVPIGQPYSQSLAGDATDPESDLITFVKISGPNWLNVSATGELTGTPGFDDAGLNQFLVAVSDDQSGEVSNALVEIVVPTGSVAHRYRFEGDVSDSVGTADGIATTTRTYLEAPQYTTEIPTGAVSSAPTQSMRVGMSFGSKKSGFTLDNMLNASAGSYSLWMKANTLTGGNYLLVAPGFKLMAPNATTLRSIYTVGGNPWNQMGNVSIAAGDWVHVVLTWEAATNSMTFYVNGSLVATKNDADLSGLSTGTIRVGAFQVSESDSNFNNQFDGWLYDLQFYDVVLSGDEVASLAANPGAAIIGPKITMPQIFNSSMVLQRDRPIPVWGQATPGVEVTVTFAGASQSVVADGEGAWRVELGALSASTVGRTMSITGSDGASVVFTDVLIGDVWVASGQSNMQLPLDSVIRSNPERYAGFYESAGNSNIRYCRVANVAGAFEAPGLKWKDWQAAEDNNIPNLGWLSAVAYFFARDVQAAHPEVPIGIISSSWGGTMIEAWMNLDAADAAGVPYDGAPLFGTSPSGTANDRNIPGILYEGMIRKIEGYGTRGFLWYQGEANAGRTKDYRQQMPFLIQSWRDAWGQGELPFLFVQLPLNAAKWAGIRDVFLHTDNTVPNTGMAVTIDIPQTPHQLNGPIHPYEKEAIGQRLALMARKMVFGDDILAYSPIAVARAVVGSDFYVRFENAGSTLSNTTSGGINGFFLSDDGTNFVAADSVQIDGDLVKVSNTGLAAPTHLRYGWDGDYGTFSETNEWTDPGSPATYSNMTDLNLVGSSGLPVSPFKADNLPEIDPSVLPPANTPPRLVMPAVFRSGMVFPADRPIQLWGVANAGETITASLGSASASSVVSPDGKWLLDLGKMSASASGQTLLIESSDGARVIYTDIGIGEVSLWIPEQGESGIPPAWMQSIRNPPGSIHFDFDVAGDLEGWVADQLNIMSHAGGVLTVAGTGVDARLSRQALYIQPGLVDGLIVRLRTAASGNLRLLWGSGDGTVFTNSRSQTVAVAADTGFQSIHFDLSSNLRWKESAITRIRLDTDFPVGSGVEIDWIHTSDGDYDRDGLSDWLEDAGDADNDGLAGFEDTDSNSNGITDYVSFLEGRNPATVVAPGVDSDGDGVDDLSEQTAGTDSGNPGDAPRADIRDSNGMEILANGKAGRSYTLERSTNLTSGSWSAIDTGAYLTTDQTLVWRPAAQSERAFYRIQIEGIPSAPRTRFGAAPASVDAVGGDGILDNGTLRIEAAVANGASLTHFSGPTGENLINNWDKGRLVQQSYFAGQDLDRTSEGQSNFWSPWPWNPIQGGDFSEAPSPVLDVSLAEFGGGFFSRTVPLLWDMTTKEQAQALIDQWNEFEPGMPNVIRVTCRFISNRDADDIWGAARLRGQELPASYFIRDLSKVVSYTGGEPWSGAAVEELSYSLGPPWNRGFPTEFWMANVDPSTDVGVGLYSPVEFHHWNYGAAGNPPGGPSSASTMHIAPVNNMILERQHILVYRYWLIYGHVDEIRDRVYELRALYPNG